jgi:hypothetical protein
MFTQLLALVSAIAYVRAASGPLPDTPTGGQQVGGKCTIQWAADPSGIWKTMYIELMAGPNVPMQHLTSEFSSLRAHVLASMGSPSTRSRGHC